MMKPLLTSLALGLCSLIPASAAETFFYRDGDRAVFLGDSITEGRQYSTLIETYVLSRFPNWKISFRHVGWSGDTMTLRLRGGVEKGYQRDVAPLKPTAATVCFGMNDARKHNQGIEAYLKGATELADLFKADNVRLAFISSSPEEHYDEGEPAGSAYNRELLRYTEGLAGVAKEKGVLCVDQLTPMIGVIERGRAAGILSDTAKQPRLVPDRVHPSPQGGFVTAAIVLEAFNAPALVSSVEIDAAAGKATAQKATVSELAVSEKGVEFTRLDESMPWPVRPPMLLTADVPEFNPLGKLSRYELKVTNLPAAKYEVAIGERKIGVFTREELAAGVNLAAQAIGAMPEVQTLFTAVDAKNALFHQLWRGVKVANLPKWLPEEAVADYRAKEVERMEAELAKQEEAIEPLRQPKAHRWSLTPQP